MRKIVKGISNVIFTILLVLLAISFYSWFQISVQHKPYSSFFGYSMFEVVTGSMSGTIEVNDYIIVKKDNNLKLKDIVTFKDGDSLVTHRIVEIKQKTIITRGDVNNSNDIEITYDDVIGKVIYVIPNGATWKKVFMDWKILVLLFISVLFFTFYFSVEPEEKKKHKKEIIEVKEEKEPELEEEKVEEPTIIEEVIEEIIEEKIDEEVKEETLKLEEETYITPMEEVLKAISNNTKKKKEEEVKIVPKKRGRPKKVVEEVVTPPKKRGRPRKETK